MASFLGLAISIYISRIYGPEDKGFFAFTISIATLISLIYFSLNQALITIKDQFKKEVIINTALSLFFYISIILLIFTIFFFKNYILHSFLAISIFSLLLWGTFTQFYNIVLTYNAVFLLSKLIFLIALIFIDNLNIKFVLWLLVLVNIFTPIITNFFLSIEYSLVITKSAAIAIIKNGSIIHLSGISMMLISEYLSIYIGNNIGYHELGIYDLLKTIYSSFLLISIGIVPYINSKAVNLPQDEFISTYLKVISFSLILISSILLIINLFASKLVFVLYGEAFSDAIPLVGMASFIGFCIVVNNLIGCIWIINNHFTAATLITSFVAAAFLFCLYFFSPTSLYGALKLFSLNLLFLSLINFIYLTIYVIPKKNN